MSPKEVSIKNKKKRNYDYNYPADYKHTLDGLRFSFFVHR